MEAEVGCVTIKIEPDIKLSSESEHNRFSVNNGTQNSGNNNRKSEEAPAPAFEPVFVRVKKEPEFCDDTVKTEPTSPKRNMGAWHDVPVKYEPPWNGDGNEKNKINVEVSIKTEPVDTEPAIEHQNSDYIVPDSVPEVHRPFSLFVNNVPESIFNLNSADIANHTCPVCHKTFANKGNVSRHLIEAHTRAQLECNVCFRKFSKKGLYDKHLLTHNAEKRFKCEECGKRFRTSSNLEQHKRIHLLVKPFQCQKCTRQFAVKANLAKHQRSGRCKVPNTDPIVCTVCNKVFQKEFLLKSHLRRHTTERPYECDKCKMCFKYKSTLIRHVQLHNNIKPYSCNICKKKFTHSGLIKPHMRKHTGEKPYACPICDKSFAHKHNMQRHTARHAKQKNLVCEVCNKKFPKESRLIYHMRTHTKAKPFKCGVCPKTFSHRQNIIRHYSRKHPNDTYNCTDTDAKVAKDVWENVVLKKNMEVKVEVKEVDSSDDEPLLSVQQEAEEIIGK